MPLETPTYIDDLTVTNPAVNDARSEGDDHLRNLKTAIKNTFPGLAGRSWRAQTKSSGYTVLATDNMTLLSCTAALTLALVAAATLGNGHMFLVHANGGDVLVDPNGAETVNGVASVTVRNGSVALVLCNGSSFICNETQLASVIELSPVQITATQNDYNPTGLAGMRSLRINSDARRNVTGLQGGYLGRVLAVHNVGTFPIPFTYEDAASSAANRFAFGITLGGGQSMEIQYDSTSSRWRLKSAPPDPVGAIREFGGGTVPAGYLARDGSNVSRTTYAALFNEVGTTWGVGDGSTTFGVGDDRRRAAVGSGGTGTATLGNVVGNTGGGEMVTLSAANIPPLSAQTLPPYSAGGNNAPNPYKDPTDHNTGAGFEAVNAGSPTTPVSIIQPSTVVTKMIKF